LAFSWQRDRRLSLCKHPREAFEKKLIGDLNDPPRADG